MRSVKQASAYFICSDNLTERIANYFKSIGNYEDRLVTHFTLTTLKPPVDFTKHIAYIEEYYSYTST